ncbi:isocitrate lyase/PEP mutase family protein [Pseudaestuariivita sp.]|uniref:isocitrate lyase/PEP mutase family protein n=1 Tax=Pseudaestuariivita sp. TaxID=2211669 RepID=UPI004058A341
MSLRTRLARPDILMAPGAYDGLSAHLAKQAGAEAIYMTGFGVSGASLGRPDVGLMSATEMTERTTALALAAGGLPLIADGDTGHGGVLNVARLVQGYERAGAAAIQLEDQVFPKRCGHMAGKAVIDTSEAAAKIEAAVQARQSDEFLIIARTDARAVTDLDDALRRGEAFLSAGADVLFIEAPQTLEEMRKVAETFAGVPLVANMVEDGKTPYLDTRTLQELGYSLAIFPVSTLLVVTRALQVAYAAMLGAGRLPEDTARISFQDYNSALGLETLLASATELEDKT